MHKCNQCGNHVEDTGQGHAWNCSHKTSHDSAYYFVAKSPNGHFVGQMSLEEIAQRLSKGDLLDTYVATRRMYGRA